MVRPLTKRVLLSTDWKVYCSGLMILGNLLESLLLCCLSLESVCLSRTIFSSNSDFN